MQFCHATIKPHCETVFEKKKNLINEVHLQQQIKATTVEKWRKVIAHPEERRQSSAES